MLASGGITAVTFALLTGSTGPIIDESPGVTIQSGSLAGSLVAGAFESDQYVRVVDEIGLQILTEPLTVDTLAFHGFSDMNDAAPAVLPAGTYVVSLLFHVDPVGSPSTPVNFSAWLKSDGPVALIYSDALLDASDAIVGHPSATYPTGLAGRGLEADDIEVTLTPVSFAPHAATTSINWSVSGNDIDSMRVILAVSLPEPTAAAIMAGLSGLLLRRGRKEKR